MGKLRLKTKLLAAISVLIVGSSTLALSVGFVNFRQDVMAKAKDRLSRQAWDELDGLSRTLRSQVSFVRLLGKLRTFSSALQFGIFDEVHAFCVTWPLGSTDVASVALLDAARLVRASSGAHPIGQPFTGVSLDAPWHDQEWQFHDVHWDALQSKRVYSVAVRVRQETDLGYLVVDFDWDRLVSAFAPDPGAARTNVSARRVLYDAGGLLVAASEPALAGRVFRERRSGGPVAGPRQTVGVVERDLLGRRVISGHARAASVAGWEGPGWELVVSEDVSAALGVLRRVSLHTGLAAAGMTLLGCLLAWLFISRYVADPIRLLVDSFRRVASGDLRCELGTGAEDELGQLHAAAGAMVLDLRGLVARVVETSGQVAEAVADLGGVAAEVAEGSQRQSAAAEQTLETMTLFAATGESVADTALALATNVEETCATVAHLSCSVEEISASTGGLAESVRQTTSSIEEMTRSVQQLAGLADVQAESVAEATRAIGEISGSVNRVVGSVREAEAITRRSEQEGEAGGEAVRQTAGAMEKMRRVIEATAAAIRKLEARSAEVGTIVRLIDDISTQTSLLALNAAIIAAQAGDGGKGFAVVAENVRSLAQRTKVAAKEIAGVIGRSTEETSEAVGLAEETLKEAQEGADLSRVAEDSIASILAGVTRSAHLLSEIVVACTRQQEWAGGVVGTVARLTATTDELRAAAVDQARASHQIRSAAETVTGITAQVDAATRSEAAAAAQIVRTVDEMSLMTQQVARATENQSERSEAVVEAMKRVRDMAARNLEATSRLAGAAELLTDLGQGMAQSVRRFRV